MTAKEIITEYVVPAGAGIVGSFIGMCIAHFLGILPFRNCVALE